MTGEIGEGLMELALPSPLSWAFVSAGSRSARDWTREAARCRGRDMLPGSDRGVGRQRRSTGMRWMADVTTKSATVSILVRPDHGRVVDGEQAVL
jgi:hypothetical protein